MTLRTRLYDANGEDRDVELTSDEAKGIHDQRLLWVDLDERSNEDLETLAAALARW